MSTASMMIGVAASSASKSAVLIAGISGLVAGAMSMAVGEYVSVSSQRDAERADAELEARELAEHPEAEAQELAAIYVKRGLDESLAQKVAAQLMAHGGLAAHLRDELNIEPDTQARPIQAALISAASFGAFALVPILTFLVAPASLRIVVLASCSLASLGSLGALGGYLGGAPMLRAAIRVTLGGGFAMAVTALVGRLFGVVAA